MLYRAYLNSLVNEGYGSSRRNIEGIGKGRHSMPPSRDCSLRFAPNRSEELNLVGLQRFEDILHVCPTGHQQGALA